MFSRREVLMAEPRGMGHGPAEERFDALYRVHHQEIAAYCLRRLPPAEAEDVTADVFVVAWRRIDDVPPAEDAIAWLFAVAHRMLSNHRRTGRRILRLRGRLGGLATPPANTPETQVIRSAEQEALLGALDGLRQADQEILKLVTWEQLSHATVAEMLGISETAVSQRVHRARKRLGEELDRMEGSGRRPLSRRKGGLR